MCNKKLDACVAPMWFCRKRRIAPNPCLRMIYRWHNVCHHFNNFNICSFTSLFIQISCWIYEIFATFLGWYIFPFACFLSVFFICWRITSNVKTWITFRYRKWCKKCGNMMTNISFAQRLCTQTACWGTQRSVVAMPTSKNIWCSVELFQICW